MARPSKEAAPTVDGPAAPPSFPPKHIYLFSDGTGNSSAKLQKTNVWRLYEALDLGTAPASGAASGPGGGGAAVQIAYYDNGVGTSAIPALAALGGIFGFGLARNVRGLYKFLCRNYCPGDRIFAFGFSRGAFTIRLLVGFIVCLGVARAENEAELDRLVNWGWRKFRGTFKPYVFSGLPTIIRALENPPATLARWGRRLLKRPDPTPPDGKFQSVEIEFVGVWDTVAAYGGPFVEVTRGIDMMLRPLSMDNFQLNPAIRCARHAIAIDDKRESFAPLPWDEVHEQALVAAGKVAPDRLSQVFFAGMHSDVGGGYADDSLAYVSLVWMIEQARPRGLRLIPETERRIRDFANSLGPIHDSRQGVGTMYRYQPRPIAAWLDPRPPAHWPQLDPASGRGARAKPSARQQRQAAFGSSAEALLVGPITIHHSVRERLERGLDGYAPNNLPSEMRVIDDRGAVTDWQSRPAIAAIAPWTQRQVSLRRTAYFLTSLVVGLMVAMPWWPKVDEARHPVIHWLVGAHNDDRDIAGPIYALLRGLLPTAAHSWTDLWVFKFWPTLMLVMILLGLTGFGVSRERRMADRYARIYRPRAGDDPVLVPSPVAEALLNDRRLNWAKAFGKWYVVPFIVGSLILLSMIYVGVASVSQYVMFMRVERRNCEVTQRMAPPPADATPRSFAYRPSDGCRDTGVRVEEGKTYVIELSNARWTDHGIAATPRGWVDPPWTQAVKSALLAPFRRVVRAPDMAPIVEIIPNCWMCGEMVERLDEIDYSGDRWVGRFTAQRSGSLLMFLNDPVLPVDGMRRNGRTSPTVLNVRSRLADTRFADGADSGAARIWQGSDPTPLATRNEPAR